MRTCLMEIDLLIRFYTMEKLERKFLRFHLIFSFVLFYFLLHLCIIIFLQSSDRKWIHLLPFDFKYRPLLINAMLATYYYTLHNFQRFFWIDVSYDLHIGAYFVPKKCKIEKCWIYTTKKCRIFKKRVNLVFQLPPSK